MNIFLHLGNYQLLKKGVTNSCFILILYRLKTQHIYIHLFQVTKSMHNSFILEQYICYIIILDMFRAVTSSSSGGQIVLLQPVESSLSVNSRTVW